MPTTLYEYYKEKGQALPSVAARAPLAAQYGIQNYTGTADQNNLLLSKLLAADASTGSLAPESLPPPGTPSGGSTGATLGSSGSAGVGDQAAGSMANLRLALRSALQEASQAQVKSRISALSPLMEGGAAPSVMTAALGLAQAGLRQTREQTFSDIVAAYKDASEAKKKEIERIQELRLKYGSAIPYNVTDLQTAIGFVTPLIDTERAMEAAESKARLAKLQKDQVEDNDIESWAQSFAKGEINISNVPAGIRTQVKVRADVISAKLESEAKEEYKGRIAFRIEKKVSDYETERALVTQDDNLTVAEQREIIDYIDSLEQAEKATKKTSGKGFFNFLSGGGAPPPPAGTPKPSIMEGYNPGKQLLDAGSMFNIFGK